MKVNKQIGSAEGKKKTEKSLKKLCNYEHYKVTHSEFSSTLQKCFLFPGAEVLIKQTKASP